MAIDPVCKMEVDEKKAKFKSKHQDKTYYFCASGCKTAFDNNPEKYCKKVESDHPKRRGCC
ncbi:MAG TPA: YHS domain-containing protein [Candidatus Atribacteria bacterium]|nr:YHS domain-containing protein [Candidatus Atribacteria bacterium]